MSCETFITRLTLWVFFHGSSLKCKPLLLFMVTHHPSQCFLMLKKKNQLLNGTLFSSKPIPLTLSYTKQAQSYLWTRITFPESADTVKHLG